MFADYALNNHLVFLWDLFCLKRSKLKRWSSGAAEPSRGNNRLAGYSPLPNGSDGYVLTTILQIILGVYLEHYFELLGLLCQVF